MDEQVMTEQTEQFGELVEIKDTELEELAEAIKRIRMGAAYLAEALFLLGIYMMTDSIEPGLTRVLCHSVPAVFGLFLFLASITTLWDD